MNLSAFSIFFGTSQDLFMELTSPLTLNRCRYTFSVQVLG